MALQSRVLGNTGLVVSELGFGGIPILRLENSAAERIVRHAYDQGITFFDTANLYRDSEQKMGLALAGMRQKVVFATKTMRRDSPGALQQLEQSLRMLKTDCIDLYQLHQLAHPQEWDAIMAPGGVLEVLQKAKQEGKIRFIGVLAQPDDGAPPDPFRALQHRAISL
jgi:uncharacterized protein